MFFSEKEILDRWEKRLLYLRGRDFFNIYVDSPFCVNQCLYCKHKGFALEDYMNEYKEYYESLLVKQIERFNFLLEMRTPDTIYFGGGTSSIMSPKVMLSIFDSIFDFKKIENKVFECNPNLITEEKIEILIDYGFSYVSFGIQSFDKNILDYNKRKGYKKVLLKKYIKRLQSSGVFVNCDLMAFISSKKGDLGEIDRVKKDLMELIENYQAKLITIYPETSFLRENKERGITMSYKLREMIIEMSKKYELNHQDKHLSLDKDDIFKEMEICYHVGKIDSGKIDDIKKYDSSGPPNQAQTQNCLSFGGFKDHRPYSYHGQEFIYYNLNESNKEVVYFGEENKKQEKVKFSNINFI